MQSLDLTAGRAGAAPLWLLGDGTLSTKQDEAQAGLAARDVMIHAARWISTRRTSTFDRLFAPDPRDPNATPRDDRLTASQGEALLAQVKGVLAATAVGSDEAKRDALAAAEARSAALTVLSHLVATALRDASFRAVSDAAAAEMFRLVDMETGEAARSELRAHAIMLLQLRGPSLSSGDREKAKALIRSLIREAPPYEQMDGPWHFAMCSDYEFHEGEVEVLERTHRFTKIDVPKDAPVLHDRWGGAMAYKAFEAPFKTPKGHPIRILARAASPTNENLEMAEPFFQGILINRHAQLGSFDMRASTVRVEQKGYKFMMNSQCAGLTTRFAISRMFPDADIYSSWDSTYFRTDKGGGSGKVIASEGLDCFVAALEGMSKGEPHSKISDRIRRSQWSHDQAMTIRDFVQFVGPAHPMVVERFTDVNQDGKADVYDGYLDLRLAEIAESIEASMTAKDPGVAASQVGGEAAKGLQWAAGSMNRVTQYSDLWSALPGKSELFYAFEAAGFYSHKEPPADVAPGALQQDIGKLPAVCRMAKKGSDATTGFTVEVMFHSYLAHAGKEMKRLLVAADALWRAADQGYLESDELKTPLAQRGMLLLTLAGLLEFPADANYLDGLWSMALWALQLPEISRSLVRACITQADHDMSNYYGSRRGLKQLLDTLQKKEPLAYEKLKTDAPGVGRALEIEV